MVESYLILVPKAVKFTNKVLIYYSNLMTFSARYCKMYNLNVCLAREYTI